VVGSGQCTAISNCGSGLRVRLTRAARAALRHGPLRTRATIVRIGNSLGALPQTERVKLVPGADIWDSF